MTNEQPKVRPFDEATAARILHEMAGEELAGREGDDMKFRKKPVVVEAMQFQSQNVADLFKWAGVVFAVRLGRDGEPEALYIPTLDDELTAQLGDWIIKGVKGEFYLCEPDTFEATYEPVREKPLNCW